ncbi:hypothetical protein N7457_004656 [Penicillium paradoxum]|uniref:uncharacterized protein n=1 Tax=Penicillium paradoxum TaxID=176176 RepID=UPI0025480FBF|nr:uncharacterized protein N7457_004656 [Penicillium paradoxum]KAJ5782882.1 hypothetical protein N7457_004656 [Penicillium paradoxum]
MRFQSLALLAGATTAIAADTVTLFLPGFDSQDIVGKVIGSSGPKTTTYLINCPNMDADQCGIPADGITVVQGSSSVGLSYGFEIGSITESCTYDASTVSCGATIKDGEYSSVIETVVSRSEFPGALMPVTITGSGTAAASATTGASAAASTATSTGEVNLSTSASTSTGTATGDVTKSARTSTATGTATGTETDNAAVPMITGNARWAAGGVAAALALAAL